MITVIIPVYNNGATIERCINSIISQSYDDVEIIVVNDGSIDNSRKICETYSEEYDNVCVINSTHVGISEARNIALKMAKGEYVAFCDADDVYLPGAFIAMVEAINNADAVIGYVIKRRTPTMEDLIINSDEAISRFFSNGENRILGTVYGKLFKRELIGQNVFEKDLSIGEDAVFILKYLFRCKSVALISSTIYHHFENPTGIICSVKEGTYISAILACKEMINYIIEYQEKAHLEEAIQDLLNVLALLLLRIRSLPWGTKIFTLVLSILRDIKTAITINGISIYMYGTYYRTMNLILVEDVINEKEKYCIQWPASIILIPTMDNIQNHLENLYLSKESISLCHNVSNYKQYFMIDIKDMIESHANNSHTYLGIAYFDDLTSVSSMRI